MVMMGMPADPKYEYTSDNSGHRQMFAASSSTQHIGVGRRRLLSAHSDCANWNAVKQVTAVRLAVSAVLGLPCADSRYSVSSLVANARGSNTGRVSRSRGWIQSMRSGSARNAHIVCRLPNTPLRVSGVKAMTLLTRLAISR